MAFLLLLMTALAATTFVVSTHAFLLPSPASAPATTTRAVVGPLFARYTSKDTGDRKKKNRARGFQAAKRRQQRGKGDGEGEEGGGAMFGDEGGCKWIVNVCAYCFDG